MTFTVNGDQFLATTSQNKILLDFENQPCCGSTINFSVLIQRNLNATNITKFECNNIYKTNPRSNQLSSFRKTFLEYTLYSRV